MYAGALKDASVQPRAPVPSKSSQEEGNDLHKVISFPQNMFCWWLDSRDFLRHWWCLLDSALSDWYFSNCFLPCPKTNGFTAQLCTVPYCRAALRSVWMCSCLQSCAWCAGLCEVMELITAHWMWCFGAISSSSRWQDCTRNVSCIELLVFLSPGISVLPLLGPGQVLLFDAVALRC